MDCLLDCLLHNSKVNDHVWSISFIYFMQLLLLQSMNQLRNKAVLLSYFILSSDPYAVYYI